MAKQEAKQTGMSRVVSFEVSLGRDKDKINLGKYNAKITFGTVDQAVDAAARSVVIRMQSNVRKAHEESKALPYPTDKLFLVDHMGTYSAPLEEVARRTIAAMTPEMRAAFAKAWLEENAIAEAKEETAKEEITPAVDDETDVIYDEDQLNSLSRARLEALAHKEDFEGVEDMKSSEIIDELLALNN